MQDAESPDPRTRRSDGRALDELRPVAFDRDFTGLRPGLGPGVHGPDQGAVHRLGGGPGPALDAGQRQGLGDRRVLDAPGSTAERARREAAKGKQSGRTQEIQRLIGRSLRAVCDLVALGEVQVTVDCDVLQADGGTRTASICGAYVALHDAFTRMRPVRASWRRNPLTDAVAAVSVGIVDGVPMLDLPYVEDSRAEVDMNVVMTGSGRFVEVQGTAEGMAFSRSELDELLALAETGIAQLVDGPGGHPGRASGPPVSEVAGGQRLTLVLATANPDKAAEVTAILAAAGTVELLPRPDEVGEVEETGDTLVANARLKARALAEATGLPAVADDTGLEVDALGRRSRGLLRPLRRRGGHLRRQRGQAAGRAGCPGRRRRGPGGPLQHGGPGRLSRRRRDLDRRQRGGVASPRSPGGRRASATTRSSSPTRATGGPSPRWPPAEKHAISHRGRAFRALAQELARRA